MNDMAEEEDLPEDDMDDRSADRGDPDAEGVEGEEESGGGKKKLIMMAAALVLLLGGVGAGLYFTGMLDGVLGKGEAGTHGEGKAKKDEHGGGHGEGGLEAGFIEVPTIVVNLNTDEDDVPRYLRLTVQLDLEDPSMKPAVESILPRVVDQFQTYLRELHVRDLKGSAGIYRLQMELLWRVNEAAAPAEIKDILFQEILIQ